MRRAFVAVVAALLVAVAGSAGRAVADSAVPSWRPSGALVDGATDAAGASALNAGRLYRDRIGAGEAKAYKVYLDASSSAYLSAFAVPGTGTSVRPLDGLKLELKNSAGTLCDTYQAIFGARDAARPVGGYVARDAGTQAECRSAGWYVLWVTRNSASGSDLGDWPLEIRYALEPGLIPGAAQPQPAAAGYSTASPTPVTGRANEVHGGSGLDDATALRGGVWKDSVRPGQTLFYKVRADWGQRVAVVADFGEASARKQREFGVSIARVEMYSPMRGYVGDDSASYIGRAASAWLRTAPISYGNRLDGSRAVSAARMAGWYYLAVSVDEKAARFVEGAIPVTLRVDVSGKAVSGPAYAGASSDGGSDAADSPSQADGISGGARSTTLRIVGFVALGTGTLLVLSLILWTTVATRQHKTAGTTS